MRKLATLFLSAAVFAGSFMATGSFAYAEGEVATVEEVLTEAEVIETEEEQDAGEPENISDLNLATSLEGVAIPEGAEQITYNLKGNAVQAARTADDLILLPVEEADASISWYVYDESSDTAIPYTRFSNLEEFFVIVPVEEDFEVPEEFVSVSISLDGKTLPAWRNPSVDDVNMYFIYAMDSSGEKAIYRFDGDAGLLMRYVPDVIEPETVETEPPTDDPELLAQLSQAQAQASSASLSYQSLKQTHEEDMLYRSLIIIGLGAIALIFLLIIVILAVKLGRKNRDEEEEEEEEEEVHYSESGIRVRKRDRVDAEAYEDTRRNGREEGTSSVRPVQRAARRYEDEGAERSTTTSNVKPAARTKKTQARQNAEHEMDDEEYMPRRTAKRRADLQDSGEKAQQPRERKKNPQRAQTSQDAEQPVRKPVRRKRPASTWEGEQQEDVTVDFTQDEQTADFSQANEAEVSRKKSVKTPVVEDLFDDDDLQGDDDFDLTDFKDV